MQRRALDAFRSALGADHVIDDAAALATAGTATFATKSAISAIVRPAERSEVEAVVRIARAHRVALHPVSCGKNWGLGSRVPSADGAVLVELGRMNRIVDFDEELAHVTVEPGVSFRQLYAFLKDRGSRLFMSSTGASPDSSVLANAIERGDGSGPNGDRALHLAALEVVLGSGHCVHTGFARFGAAARLAPLHRFGVGPALDGLFTQSNLGIVTRATIWLAPLPRYLALVRFGLVDRARLGPVIDAARRLKLEGVIAAQLTLWNDYRVLSAAEQHPLDARGDRAERLAARLGELRREAGGVSWFGVLPIYAADAEIGKALVRRVEAELRPLVDRLSVTVTDGARKSGEEPLPDGDPAFWFFQGIPHQESLRSVYFRKSEPAPDDPEPDRDRCGVIWLCPTLPLVGADALAAVELAERILVERGFDPLLALVSQTARTAYFLPLIVYDRDHPGEDERARAAHDALLAALSSAGYLPHRLGLASFDALPEPSDDHGVLIARLKRALDPDDVIAPGRYDFRRSWPKNGE